MADIISHDDYHSDPRNPPNQYLQERTVLALERLGDLLESLISYRFNEAAIKVRNEQ
jgi:hypothetical protein